MQITHDTNGNRVVKIEKSDLAGARGFSIQIDSQSFPKTYYNGINNSTDGEIRAYLAEFGTRHQKELFGVEQSASK